MARGPSTSSATAVVLPLRRISQWREDLFNQRRLHREPHELRGPGKPQLTLNASWLATRPNASSATAGRSAGEKERRAGYSAARVRTAGDCGTKDLLQNY